MAPMALAVSIMPGTYILGDHPGGDLNPPSYGLRIDQLLGEGTGMYTFSFSAAGSHVELVYNDVANTIQISGLVYGGRVSGSSYVGTPQYYSVDFLYDTNVGTCASGAAGAVDVCASTNGGSGVGSNRGTLTAQGTDINNLVDGTLYNLADYTAAPFTPVTFQFGDEDGAGHRGYNGLSGWGWLATEYTFTRRWGSGTYTKFKHYGAQDWLFTATKEPDTPPDSEVPEPGTVVLLGSALAAFAWKRRQNRR